MRDYDDLCKEVESLRDICRDYADDVQRLEKQRNELLRKMDEYQTIISALVAQVRGTANG